ncbi:DUF882 domain-containing protein [Pseudochrobactrum sp. Wa41.01b-1]|uniref:DUF882 domain-containing protein n=1 Tax=Pseudochrobactrum sp. Wa41.01b-1 TaxID=2864102 RepID=UPI001C68AC04|nr:DUF882 domain-containing protein [Pseudochrobactrum sp. Wa41.01b-1]
MENSKTSKLAGWAGRVFKLSAQLALVFTAVTAFAPSQAAAETRTLKLHFVHTGERAEITFKKNGRYLPDGLKKLNVFLRDWRRNEPTKMDPRLFDLVWQVYQTAGGRDYITVVSAYRSPATNSMLRSRTRGVAKSSQHTLGKAMDFFIPGVPLKKLRDTALRYQIGGVGYYPTSGSPFVHLDVGSVRHWPRLSRRELLAVFPDGKTIHVPTDGKPLPGYEQALAAYEARKANGGTIQMASAKPKSKSLFGMLFGGGADEEEDNGESSGRAVATARPARTAPAAAVPARQAPVPAVPNRAVPAQPEPQVPQEALIAALPARDAPVPLNAPRPSAGVEMTPDAQAAMAFAVPVPVKRPQSEAEVLLAMAPPPPNTLEAQAFAGATGAPSAPAQPANDQIAALVAADTTVNTGAMLSGYVPVPVQRPQGAGQAINTVLAAAVPATRPTQAQAQEVSVARAEAGQDAIADLLSNNDHTASIPAPRPQAQEQQVAMVMPQDTRNSRPSSRPVVNSENTAAATGADAVRTTAKAGRSDRPASKAAANAVLQPADAATEVAISNEPVAKVVPVSNPVLRNDAMRQAPTVVYTAGFQKDLPAGNANRFTGNAVTFIPIAKFSKIN